MVTKIVVTGDGTDFPSLLLGGGDENVLLTPSEVARTFRVDPKTVTRWAKDEKLPFLRTAGGHRRFRLSDVKALLFKDEGPARNETLPKDVDKTEDAPV